MGPANSKQHDILNTDTEHIIIKLLKSKDKEFGKEQKRSICKDCHMEEFLSRKFECREAVGEYIQISQGKKSVKTKNS